MKVEVKANTGLTGSYLDKKTFITLELLNSGGELIEVDEIHCSKEIDTLKMVGIGQNPEE